MARRTSPNRPADPTAEARQAGINKVLAHPLFTPLISGVSVYTSKEGSTVPAGAWATVVNGGRVDLSATRRGSEDEWAWVFAHCLLHLGFGHVDPGPATGRVDRPYNVAACLAVNRFLLTLKMGRPPADVTGDPALPAWVTPRLLGAGMEPQLAAELRHRDLPEQLAAIGTAPGGDLPRTTTPGKDKDLWERRLAEGLEAAVAAAVSVAGGELSSLSSKGPRRTAWAMALRWFVSNYPLLGALASGLRLVEKADVCNRMGIAVAAVSPLAGELYVNPDAPMNAKEKRFVIGHELLHAGLRHDTRSGGRDPYFWNIACDYVINGWLVEMGVGDLPDGVLYDVQLKGLSAEQAYDRIVVDLRRARKLRTLRGTGACDILPGRVPVAGEAAGAVDLDAFYRRALSAGLELHRCAGRGYVPAGLVEAINALSHPPIEWDVELARWFDDHFPALERRRTYQRLSRRQSATPDIPRPALHVPTEQIARRTFGVVLDTSGSMERTLLAKALGAIASYAATRDVPAARVVFCDAAAYDAGYLSPYEIAGRVQVKGRGGTVLQPGVDLLEAARDFPDNGPILLITDGWCDPVRVRREHAWLVPQGATLPVLPRGPVFRIS